MARDASEISFTHRLAVAEDIEILTPLMNSSIAELLKPYLAPNALEASFAIMGIDTQLIADGTYFVVCHEEQIVGCGGWSRRATLFGGDHSAGRDAALLDPKTEPARVRAMYTHPSWTRRGVGRRVIDLCEAAARAEGFTRSQLAATLAGEPLYRACGYSAVEHFQAETPGGVRVPLIRMEKVLSV